MRLHQLNCQYLPEEDRLLLKVSTTDKFEYQFLITRRYCKLLIKVFLDFFSSLSKKKLPTQSSAAQKALSEFEHEEAVQKTNLTEPYEENKNISSVMLLHELQVNITKDSKLILGFYDKKKQGITVTLTSTLAHSFFHLLEKTLQAADWELTMSLTTNPKDTLH